MGKWAKEGDMVRTEREINNREEKKKKRKKSGPCLQFSKRGEQASSEGLDLIVLLAEPELDSEPVNLTDSSSVVKFNRKKDP